VKQALFILAFALLAGRANATITFNLGSAAGDLTSSHTYTAGGLSIIATGYDSHGALTDLWGKNDSGDEVGLGLKNDPTGDHEIHYQSGFVQLDVSDLLGHVSPKLTKFTTNSTTEGEEWAVYGSNTAGKYSGKPLLTGTSETIKPLPDLGMFKYYDFVEINHTAGTGDNFLIHTVTTGVPEPSTWAIMLMGFFGLGAAVRARRGRLASA
jgi:hypothetical protein